MQKTGENQLLGDEGTGKHDISGTLTVMGKSVNMKVLTCSRLPLPDDCGYSMEDIEFICFTMCTSSAESMEVMINNLAKVNVSFFLGKSAIVANTKDYDIDDDDDVCTQLNDLSSKCNTQLLYANTEDQNELLELCRKLYRKIECVVGMKSNIHPLLFDCVEMSNPVSDTTMMNTAAGLKLDKKILEESRLAVSMLRNGHEISENMNHENMT
ncbi:hypothetical protein ACF0H5_017449 [Mactra antiquata]